MNRNNYRKQAVDILGWIFGWYKCKSRHYIVPDGFQVHHIDGDCTNNSLDNLAILTIEEHRAIHKEEHNKRCKINGKMTGAINGKKSSKPVLCVGTGVIYESIREAERQTGISRHDIRRVCNGKRKTAGGYHWRYTE